MKRTTTQLVSGSRLTRFKWMAAAMSIMAMSGLQSTAWADEPASLPPSAMSNSPQNTDALANGQIAGSKQGKIDNSNTATDAGAVNIPAESTVGTLAQSPANPPSNLSKQSQTQAGKDSPKSSVGNISRSATANSRSLGDSDQPDENGYIVPPGQDSVVKSKPVALSESNDSGPATSAMSQNSMMAASPLNDYTISVMGYMILIGFLVTTLLGGAFVVVNVGLLSKREEDNTGIRDPSDVPVLKEQLWPREVSSRAILPAEEDEDQNVVTLEQKHQMNRAQVDLLVEERMAPAA